MKKNKILYFHDDFIAQNLAPSCSAIKVETKDYKNNPKDYAGFTFLIRGITNNKYCRLMKENGSNYFYIDTGYFGNFNTYYKLSENTGKKFFHRVAFNQMQFNQLEDFKSNRYKAILRFIKRDFDLEDKDFILPWKTKGKKILICPPSEKVGSVFGIEIDNWIETVCKEIKLFSNREIVIRKKPQSRAERVKWNTMQDALDDDIFILVTYNSIAATEAILHGIPAVTLGLNAATPVSLNELKDLESPIYPDRQMWLNNLSYGQFHLEELRNGTAWDCLKKNHRI